MRAFHMVSRICLLTVGLSLSGGVPAHAAVVYVPVTGMDWFNAINNWQPGGAGYGPSWEADFDQDGTPELTLTTRPPISGVSAHPYTTTEILAMPVYAFNNLFGIDAVAFPDGAQIGPGTPGLFDPRWNVLWADRFYNANDPTTTPGYFAMLSALYDVGQGGPFVSYQNGGAHYLGVRFKREDGWHYGWIHAWGSPMGLYVTGMAWETAPDTPILTEAIPEPSAFHLAPVAACILAARRRRDASAPRSRIPPS